MGPDTDLGGTRLDEDGRHQIGRNLGRILRRLVAEAGLSRAVVAGGDTSSHALSELGVLALKTLLPLPETPGSAAVRGVRRGRRASTGCRSR